MSSNELAEEGFSARLFSQPVDVIEISPFKATLFFAHADTQVEIVEQGAPGILRHVREGSISYFPAMAGMTAYVSPPVMGTLMQIERAALPVVERKEFEGLSWDSGPLLNIYDIGTENLMRELERHFEADIFHDGPYFGHLMQSVMARVACAMSGIALTDPRGSQLSAARLQRIQAYIDQELPAKISTAELADLVGLSASHFSRLFRKARGVTPQAHVLNRRVDLVVMHLTETTDTLDVIARKTGFASKSHMITVFRKRLGVTPSGFRRQLNR